MAYTTSFKTLNEIIPCSNLAAKDDIYPIALDIGYSAVKGFSPSVRFCFPSFVRKYEGEDIETPKDSILYKDSTGIYSVGVLAAESIQPKDTNDAENTMFGRNRYYSPSFLILARVGMAIAMKRNHYGGYQKDLPIFLQTGLPPAYRKLDTPMLIDALAGHHTFSICIGKGKWFDYDFELQSDCVSVIDQPIGSVYSASKKSDGKSVLASNGTSYIDNRLLVLDGGFGTLDIYSIVNRKITKYNTFDDLGMKAIFEQTAADILQQYGTEIHTHAMQSCLKDGLITVFNRKEMASEERDISDILMRSTINICNAALTRIENAYDLDTYNYLLPTGGTCTAWLPYIIKRYQRMSTLEIICADKNEPISPVYNNVRGYYIYRALSRKR